MAQRSSKKIQIGLRRQGLYGGNIDGILGPQSRTAIRQWQETNNYAVTGYLSKEQFLKLSDNIKIPRISDPQSTKVSAADTDTKEGSGPSWFFLSYLLYYFSSEKNLARQDVTFTAVSMVVDH